MPLLSRRVRPSSKGQFVIPQDMGEKLGVEAGDEVALHLVSGRLLVAEVLEPTPIQRALAELDADQTGHPITVADVERVVKKATQRS